MLKLSTTISEIDAKKALLDKKKPLPPDTLRTLKEKILLEWTHHSTAIEGNTLTLSETKVALEGITVGGKTLREHLEVVNHADAIRFVEEIVANQTPLTEYQIKSIHSLVLKGIRNDKAGVYRNENVFITGASHVPPNHLDVPSEMHNLIDWYETEASKLHPIERASRLHCKFVNIHPFVDGNGRTARLLLNFELMRSGYLPTVIQKDQRPEYYSSLDVSATNEDYLPFTTLVANLLDSSYDFYLKYI